MGDGFSGTPDVEVPELSVPLEVWLAASKSWQATCSVDIWLLYLQVEPITDKTYSGVWQILGNSFPKSASSSNSFSELILQNSHKNRAWLRPLRSVHLWVCEPNYRDVFEARLELFGTLNCTKSFFSGGIENALLHMAFMKEQFSFMSYFWLPNLNGIYWKILPG